jgi:hypothetical protein
VAFAVLPPPAEVVAVEDPPTVPPVALVLLDPVVVVPPESRVDEPSELLPPDVCVLALDPAAPPLVPDAPALPPELPSPEVPPNPPSCLLLAPFEQAAVAIANITRLSHARLLFIAIDSMPSDAHAVQGARLPQCRGAGTPF